MISKNKYLIVSKKYYPELDDGEHYRARIGFILMSTDLASESDFFKMAPEGVGIHITRLKTDDYTTNETLLRHVEHMAETTTGSFLYSFLVYKKSIHHIYQ